MREADVDHRLFESLDTFVERALNDFPNDKHIAPQTGQGAELARIIAPLERSAEVSLPVVFPHMNSTARFGELPIPLPIIARNFYATDTAYWEKVCADFKAVRERAQEVTEV